MKNWLFPFLVASLAVTSSACIITSDGDSSLTVANDSTYVLDEVFVDDGPDLLGGTRLLPGEEITIILDCGVYDVGIIDETNLRCDLIGLDVCFDDAIWSITDRELDNCFQ